MLRSFVFGFTVFGRQIHCLVDKKIDNYLKKVFFFLLYLIKVLNFSLTDNKFDVIIVGGGIVGCATARELKLTKPSLKVALIEKESKLG